MDALATDRRFIAVTTLNLTATVTVTTAIAATTTPRPRSVLDCLRSVSLRRSPPRTMPAPFTARPRVTTRRRLPRPMDTATKPWSTTVEWRRDGYAAPFAFLPFLDRVILA